MNSTTSHAESSRIGIGTDAAMSIDVRAGATIRVVRGQIWLTQEGDWRDYCVCAGMTFRADRTGRVVVDAVDGAAVIVLTQPDALTTARLPRGHLHIDSVAQLTRAARRAQAEFVAQAFVDLGTWIARQVRRLFAGEDRRAAEATRRAGKTAGAPRRLRSPGPFPLTGSGRKVYRVH